MYYICIIKLIYAYFTKCNQAYWDKEIPKNKYQLVAG